MAQPRDFGFGEDERLLRDSARKFLSQNAPVEKLRRLVARDHREVYETDVPPAAYDEELWRRMVALGWTALAVPEEAGGAGMKMVAVAALAEEAGRVALTSPLMATLFATCVLREAKTGGARVGLERLVAGEAATLAITNADGSWEPEDTDVRSRGDGGGVVLNGTAFFVQDARKAAFFVASARGDDGVGLYLVDAQAPGVAIHPDHIVDLTRDQGHVELRDVSVARSAIVALAGAGAKVLAQATPSLLAIVAADMCGAAEWQLQTTADYARVRRQFDRPLGFFQAVKHPLVNMMIEVDQARSLAYNAACAIDSEPEKAEYCARMAKASASDTAVYCSGRSVQLHGGIGFTWECDVHLFFKRQQHNALLYGDAAYQRAKLARLLEASGGTRSRLRPGAFGGRAVVSPG
jgi:alkylation response protein AidB-like acyl-CoA dehydrogenase